MDELLMVAAIVFGVIACVFMCIYWMGVDWAKYISLVFYAAMILTLIIYGIRAIVW